MSYGDSSISDKTDKYRMFYEYKIDQSIKDRINKIILFMSSNEQKGGKESLKILQTDSISRFMIF